MHTLKTIKKSQGFTLLEMLLVIAIIAILAGIVIVAINPGRQLAQARNAQRASDINAIDKALKQYYIDNRAWPAALANASGAVEICNTGGGSTSGCINLEVAGQSLVPTYLSALPQNPSGGNYVIALDNNSQISIGAPGSTEYQLPVVVIGNNASVIAAASVVGGGS